MPRPSARLAAVRGRDPACDGPGAALALGGRETRTRPRRPPRRASPGRGSDRPAADRRPSWPPGRRRRTPSDTAGPPRPDAPVPDGLPAARASRGRRGPRRARGWTSRATSPWPASARPLGPRPRAPRGARRGRGGAPGPGAAARFLERLGAAATLASNVSPELDPRRPRARLAAPRRGRLSDAPDGRRGALAGCDAPVDRPVQGVGFRYFVCARPTALELDRLGRERVGRLGPLRRRGPRDDLEALARASAGGTAGRHRRARRARPGCPRPGRLGPFGVRSGGHRGD